MQTHSFSLGLALILDTKSILGLSSSPCSSGTGNSPPKCCEYRVLQIYFSHKAGIADLLLRRCPSPNLSCRFLQSGSPATIAAVTYCPRQQLSTLHLWLKPALEDAIQQKPVYRSPNCSLDTMSYIISLVVIFYCVPLSPFFIDFFIHLLSPVHKIYQ